MLAPSILSLIGIVVFLVAPARADADPCLPCQAYLPLVQPLTLGQRVAELGLFSLHSGEGGAFYTRPEEYEARKLKLDLNSMIPESCRPKLALGEQAEARAVIRIGLGSSAAPYNPDEDAPKRLLDTYNSLATEAVGRVCDRESPGYGACLQTNAPKAYRKFSKNFSAGNVASFSKSEAKIMDAYHAMLNAGDSASALARFKEMDASLTEEQVVKLVQVWGARMRYDYAIARNQARGSAKGVVTLDRMIEAAKHNTSAGLTAWNVDDPGYSEIEFGGICRDIASGQGLMLQASRHFKDTLVVSNAKVGGSGYHVTVITRSTDQRTPNKVYRFNYRASSMAVTGDSRVFTMGSRDIAINYRIFRPGGAMVANVQSEIGKYLTEASGFDVRDVDPLARGNSTLTGGAYRFKSGTSLQATVGRDKQNSTYKTVGVSQTWGQGGILPGKVGISAGTITKQGDLGGEYKSGFDLDFIYAQIEQNVRTRRLNLTSRLQASIEAKAALMFMGSRARGSNGDGSGSPEDLAAGRVSDQIGLQADMRVSGGVRVDQSAWRDRFRATYRVGGQISPGIRDIRDNNWKQGPPAVLNHLLFSAEGRLRLAKTPEGSAYLVAATTVLWNELATRARSDVGIVAPRVGGTLGLEGRVGGGAPYEEGSQRRLSASAYIQPNRALQINATGYVPLERDLPIRPGAMGTLTFQW